VDERFWSKVDVRGPDECWPWMRDRDRDGYGRFRPMVDSKRLEFKAHRWAYEHAVGPIPIGKDIDHTCHNIDADCLGGPTCQHRACQNPAHLAVATRRENTLNGKSRPGNQARQTECIHGHPFDEANTYVRPNGKRDCRQCNVDRLRRRRCA
jgi:HNH endonuclease